MKTSLEITLVFTKNPSPPKRGVPDLHCTPALHPTGWVCLPSEVKILCKPTIFHPVPKTNLLGIAETTQSNLPSSFRMLKSEII
jgi:hypothetical protein